MKALFEIGEPELISKRDKIYPVDGRGVGYGNYVKHVIPKGLLQLPVYLHCEGGSKEITSRVRDDPHCGELKRIIMQTRILNLTGEDSILFTLNGFDLKPKEKVLGKDWSTTLFFNLDPNHVPSGGNNLKVKLLRRNPYMKPPVKIDSLNIKMEYDGSL